jgi:hypothetical protein
MFKWPSKIPVRIFKVRVFKCSYRIYIYMYSYMSVYSNITYLIMYGMYVFMFCFSDMFMCFWCTYMLCAILFARTVFLRCFFLLDVSHFGVVVSASIDRSYGCCLLSVCWVWDPAFFVPVSNHAALRYLILPAHKDVHVCWLTDNPYQTLFCWA